MDNRILIVDDDTDVREPMQAFVETAGYTAFAAASAEDALDMIEDRHIDVVITDIILPGKNGLQLTDIIKQQYNADVIVMTGYSGDYSYEEAVNKGASDFVFKPVRFEELLLRLKRVLKERKLTRERVQMLEKLQTLAITDGLTKLYNSRYFYNQLELEVNRSNRYHHPLSLLLLDIDHFKHYNDAYGHLEGDKVLVRLGQIIIECLRKMDSAYRYGGEEFTIILPETGGSEANTVACRIKNAMQIQRFFPLPSNAVTKTISIGVAQYKPKESIAGFVKRADMAMYASKQKGRNHVSYLSD